MSIDSPGSLMPESVLRGEQRKVRNHNCESDQIRQQVQHRRDVVGRRFGHVHPGSMPSGCRTDAPCTQHAKLACQN